MGVSLFADPQAKRWTGNSILELLDPRRFFRVPRRCQSKNPEEPRSESLGPANELRNTQLPQLARPVAIIRRSWLGRVGSLITMASTLLAMAPTLLHPNSNGLHPTPPQWRWPPIY